MLLGLVTCTLASFSVGNVAYHLEVTEKVFLQEGTFFLQDKIEKSSEWWERKSW